MQSQFPNPNTPEGQAVPQASAEALAPKPQVVELTPEQKAAIQDEIMRMNASKAEVAPVSEAPAVQPQSTIQESVSEPALPKEAQMPVPTVAAEALSDTSLVDRVEGLNPVLEKDPFAYTKEVVGLRERFLAENGVREDKGEVSKAA